MPSVGGLIDNQKFIDWVVNFKYDPSLPYPEIWYGPNDSVSEKLLSDHGAVAITDINDLRMALDAVID